MTHLIHVNWVDYLITFTYFAFVLGIGFFLKKDVHGSKDFFESGRHLPAWICALGFIGANLGAQEVLGMAASGAKYGILTSHFYWIGAIPAMVFIGIFMMPFYYGSSARSVPEYLKLRFDERTRGLNAMTFAFMTIFSSGISMYGLAVLLEILLGWNFHASIVISGAIVLAYILMGGLTSAIYNEVLQFFMIVFGFIPLVCLGLKDIGGWHGLVEALNLRTQQTGMPDGAMTHSWALLGSSKTSPMGVDWFGMAMGLGFVVSFGYWCTDFLVVQRAMAAESMLAARRTPILAAIPKMFIPFLVIFPGMIAIGLTAKGSSFSLPKLDDGTYNYNMTVPTLLSHYLPNGMLGVGLTALMASFMSGMAGNVTAFNTVWTYDIYQSYIKKDGTDAHYVMVGKMATVFGILLSMAAAYPVAYFNNIMDMLQLIFAFVNAPLLATFLLGMFWKRTTATGAFCGLLIGTVTAALHHGLTQPIGATSLIKGGWAGAVLYHYTGDMAQNFWTAIWAWTSCFIATIVISLLTKRDKTDEQLVGLVYSCTPKQKDSGLAWYRQPALFGSIVLIVAVILNIIFW